MFKSPTYCFLAGATSVQGHRPDFNNDLGGDSNSGPVLYPRRLFKSNSNNGPSLGHSNLVSDEVYICSGLLFMIFWWLLWPSAPCLISIREQSLKMLQTGVQEFKIFLWKISHPNIKFYFGFIPQQKK